MPAVGCCIRCPDVFRRQFRARAFPTDLLGVWKPSSPVQMTSHHRRSQSGMAYSSKSFKDSGNSQVLALSICKIRKSLSANLILINALIQLTISQVPLAPHNTSVDFTAFHHRINRRVFSTNCWPFCSLQLPISWFSWIESRASNWLWVFGYGLAIPRRGLMPIQLSSIIFLTLWRYTHEIYRNCLIQMQWALSPANCLLWHFRQGKAGKGVPFPAFPYRLIQKRW